LSLPIYGTEDANIVYDDYGCAADVIVLNVLSGFDWGLLLGLVLVLGSRGVTPLLFSGILMLVRVCETKTRIRLVTF